MLGNDNKLGTTDGPNWRINKWFPGMAAETEKKLRIFHAELLRFNKTTNLISSTTAPNADLLHFADSIIGGEIIFKNSSAKEIYDIGSGNGCPGLVMAILDPTRSFILVDSDIRKIEFLKHCISHLKLENVTTYCKRVEDFDEGAIECAISRAFAPLEKAMKMCKQAIRSGGSHYHFKSDSWGTETLRVPIQIGRYWEPSLIGDYNLPGVNLNLSIVELKRTGRK